MFSSISKLPTTYRIALAIAVFFLANATISMGIDRFAPFAAYIVGFAVGLGSACFGLAFQKQRRVFFENDLQIQVGIDLCKQLAAVPTPIAKSTPAEVVHIIYAAKAYFPEKSKSLDLALQLNDPVRA